MRREVTIDTPENVSIRFEAAGLGSRLVALFIDTLIQFGIALLIGLFVFFFSFNSTDGKVSFELNSYFIAFFIVGTFLLYTFYFVFFEMVMKGQTPGKKAAKIRVTSTTGEPINFFMSMVRNLVRIIDILPGSYLAGMLSILLNRKCQRIGDLVSNTMVIKVRSEADFKQRVSAILAGDAPTEEPSMKNASSYVTYGVDNKAYFPVNERQYRNLRKYLETRESFTRADDYDFFMFRYYNYITGSKVPYNMNNYYRLCFLTDIVNQNAEYYER